MTQDRLPVIGSSAATTAFCSARLDGPGGLHLWFDGNGKITAGNGTLHDPKPNAFSLEAEAVAQQESSWYLQAGKEHCPGATPTCLAACYVENLEKAQGATYALYRHNSQTIRTILADEQLTGDWAMLVAEWITKNASAGFRWHVSGDVISMTYAEWIADVCRESPTVRHWIYTRSFDFLAPLAEVSTLRGGNLALNLSADKDNYEAAQDAALKHAPTDETLRLCYLTADGSLPDDLGPDDVVFPDYQLRPRAYKSLAESPWWQSISQFDRGLVCPVDAHGKAENRRCGPCQRCMT